MSKRLDFTLVCDGSFDRVLIPIINWVIREQGYDGPINSQWADTGIFLTNSHRLVDRIRATITYFPAQVYIIHRDAEREALASREKEIQRAWQDSGAAALYRPLIPIRMTEAWLLFNESAIRDAAGNPHGTSHLQIPRIKQHETLSDPKQVLYNALVSASGLAGARRKKFRPHKAAGHITTLIDDYSELRRLSAFSAFESQIQTLLVEGGWHQ